MIRRALAVTVLAFAVSCPAWAQVQPPLPEIAAAENSADMYPPHNAAFADGVTGVPDVPYTDVEGFRPQVLDLYLPPAALRARGPRPFVVFVHGGAWLIGDTRTNGAFANWPAALASIASKGYVVASVSYTLAGEAPFPAAMYDVRDALRWLRSNAAKYGIDKDRAVIWGSSAGGQLAGLVATTCGVRTFDRPGETTPAAKESACVKGAVIWYGVSDLTPMAAFGDVDKYLGCSGNRCASAAKAASPVSYVDALTPPFFIVHGTADRAVPVQQSMELHDAIVRAHGSAELLLLRDIDHSFIGKTPEATRNASRDAWQRTLDFIDQTIGDKR